MKGLDLLLLLISAADGVVAVRADGAEAVCAGGGFWQYVERCG